MAPRTPRGSWTNVRHCSQTLVTPPSQLFHMFSICILYSVNWLNKKSKASNGHSKLCSGERGGPPQIIFTISYKFTYNNPYYTYNIYSERLSNDTRGHFSVSLHFRTKCIFLRKCVTFLQFQSYGLLIHYQLSTKGLLSCFSYINYI